MDIMDKLIISWKNNFLKVYFYKKNSSSSCNEVQKKKSYEFWVSCLLIKFSDHHYH